MGLVSSTGQMGGDMRGSGRRESRMERVSSLLLMANLAKVSGMMERGSAGWTRRRFRMVTASLRGTRIMG
jgi:hypothetical protein